ncbi:nuclear transport factor 2 family protein [Phaeacidiphilus oryzae]|uniref:nuclear transport factor 2 family protein n=1 Tax=Phaeacidiphilus oryzae TaxID=348818 RepID=UPI00068D878E|nr:nuclear transport factor 2 family protein [Phaeacidiphilus oryzae]
MSENRVPTPREVAEEQLRRIDAAEFDTVAELYAEDVRVETPFSRPRRVIESRAQVADGFRAAAGQVRLSLKNQVLYTTDDPEVVVAEYDLRGEVLSTGREFEGRNVLIYRVRDGLIVESHDYHDHVAVAEAMAAGEEKDDER